MIHMHAGKLSQQLRVPKHCAGMFQPRTVTPEKLLLRKCVARLKIAGGMSDRKTVLTSVICQ